MTVLDVEKCRTTTIHTPAGVRIVYDSYGAGPPLVLVHGSFSNHRSNWMYVMPRLEAEFTVHAVARRGRGRSDATVGHSVRDEIEDVIAVVRSIGQPAYLLGHSYGAHVAMGVAAEVPHLVRGLIAYEPPRLDLMSSERLNLLAELAGRNDWEEFAIRFFVDALRVPSDDIALLRETADWQEILADASATLHDFSALARHSFDAEWQKSIAMPVLLQTGSESPPDLYLTHALAASLAQARIDLLHGAAHEGMTTAPHEYVDSVRSFLADVS